MTMIGALLLRNPPAGYRPQGWSSAQLNRGGARIHPRRNAANLYLLPDSAAALSTMILVVGAFGNAAGRILSGWMSDRLGRINVLRTMIGICIGAMPAAAARGKRSESGLNPAFTLFLSRMEPGRAPIPGSRRGLYPGFAS
jgi:MFS family permease